MSTGRFSAVEDHVQPPVLAALLFDLAQPDGADLAGACHMGAAAGLKICSASKKPGQNDRKTGPRKTRCSVGGTHGKMGLATLIQLPANTLPTLDPTVVCGCR